ncbi:ArsR/SmtB family transcription factor [Pedococcus bigeumensis]|uniref:ArsR family transcriptional regulator n=1 Tax=Pedococcus bigeumensis TaxID=433644 RepID=A0A502CNX4_9MICO|nr:winged helix-turn-helix domain-containing protein [Pedococcus bigeumensis]TPG13401.1 ArsR family transcriptional regulator [Pedococcus bigeumensis]
MVTQAIVVDSGTSFHLLTSIASVADKRWCEVLDAGPALARDVSATAGRDLLADVRAPGRFGWMNLLSLAAAGRGPRTVDDLLVRLVATQPTDLHLAMLGGRRRQLVELVSPDVLASAVVGERAALTQLRRVFAGDDTVLEATSWLLRGDSAAVKRHVVGVLETWRDRFLPAEREASLRADLRLEARRRRADLARLGAAGLMARVAPTLAYLPHPAPTRVVLFPVPAMAPVVVVVDELQRTLIGYPPVAGQQDDEDALLLGARALADPVRLRMLEILGPGGLTAQELAAQVGAPRTTLLHHLALMRAAGLVQTAVGAGHSTVYSLRQDGLARVADEVRSRFDVASVENSRH